MSPVDLREAFVGKVARVDSSLGPLDLGVVDAARHDEVARAISGLLFRSIDDARASVGGHLPDWLVADIKRNYISPERVQTRWAAFGHRFGLMREGELLGTVHLTREHDTIFTINREVNNVSSRQYPGFKPERYHHVVNLSVKHEVRRARLATVMFAGIDRHFRELFDGEGLWVRADPPWHASLVGLGFVHDPSMDIFLPPEVEKTAGLEHADFNRLFSCDCQHPSPQSPEALADRPRRMLTDKLQYVSVSRPFGSSRQKVIPGGNAPVERSADPVSLDRRSSDWGLLVRRRPSELALPRTAAEVAEVLALASSSGTPVVVRGAGFGPEGQSLTSGLALSTERLDRVLSLGSDRVRVEAGLSWQALVEQLSPHRLYPPVLTGWLPATVGGTLSTLGFSKGSARHGVQLDHVLELLVATGDGRLVACSPTQAAWLFESALGGLGQFGVIVEATLRLARPDLLVAVERSQAPSPLALRARLDKLASSDLTYHLTAFARPDGSFGIVRAGRMELAPPHPDPSVVPLASYVAPARPKSPPGPSLFLGVTLPADGLTPFVDACLSELVLAEGDAMQIVPVRKLAERRSSLCQLPSGPVGSLAYAVVLTRELRGRGEGTVRGGNERLFERALSLGGRSTMLGGVPRGTDTWRTYLGEGYESVAARKRMADPAGVLGREVGLI